MEGGGAGGRQRVDEFKEEQKSKRSGETEEVGFGGSLLTD